MSPEVPIIVLIISIPTYFVCRWLMRKLKIGKNHNRKYYALIPTIILSPMIYVGIIMIWIFSISYYPSDDFKKADWNNYKMERYKLTEDLIESEILLGKTKKEVIEILGDDFHGSDNYIYYEIGHVPGLFNIDPSYLDIHFENNRVIKVLQKEG